MKPNKLKKRVFTGSLKDNELLKLLEKYPDKPWDWGGYIMQS
jgi:hypothetical protein